MLSLSCLLVLVVVCVGGLSGAARVLGVGCDWVRWSALRRALCARAVLGDTVCVVVAVVGGARVVVVACVSAFSVAASLLVCGFIVRARVLVVGCDWVRWLALRRALFARAVLGDTV